MISRTEVQMLSHDVIVPRIVGVAMAIARNGNIVTAGAFGDAKLYDESWASVFYLLASRNMRGRRCFRCGAGRPGGVSRRLLNNRGKCNFFYTTSIYLSTAFQANSLPFSVGPQAMILNFLRNKASGFRLPTAQRLL